jgi:hypothetical protein
MSSNTVTFKVAGNDVLSFIDQIKKKSDQQTAEMIANAKKQSSSAKDQIKDIEAQIKALEKRNTLEANFARVNAIAKRDERDSVAKQQYETKYAQIMSDPSLGTFKKARAIGDARETMEASMVDSNSVSREELKTLRENERLQALQVKMLRDNNDTIKSSSMDQVQQMRRNSSDLIDAVDDEQQNDPRWQLANRFAREQYKEGGDQDFSKSVVGGMLNVSNLQNLMGSVNQVGATQNGFDLIQPASKGIGNVIGMVLGGVIGGLASGGAAAMVGVGIGGQIGSMLGDSVGQFEQRRLMAAQEFLGGKAKYEATTQNPLTEITDLSKMGVSATDYVTTLRQIAINTGNTAMATTNTRDALELEKGAGVSRDVSSQMITYFRGTNKDISNLVGGIMAKGKNSVFGGGDYTFLNEFLQKFNSLQTELRSTSENVSTGTTFDILNTFNRIGGQFSSRDPRSGGLVSGVNSALANPASDSLQAMSFLALRKDNPNMSYAQLMEEKQKGLGSPSYLKSMLKMIDEYGGDRSAKITNSTWLTGGNFAAARRLWDNKGQVGTMSTKDIETEYTGDFSKSAESKTTVIEQNMASIKNGLLSTWGDGVEAMVNSFSNAMSEALNGAVIQFGDNGKIQFGTIKVNAVKNNVDAAPEKGRSFDSGGRLSIGHTNHK